jgi:hypothetical protein
MKKKKREGTLLSFLSFAYTGSSKKNAGILKTC